MNASIPRTRRWIAVLALIAIAFGIVTIVAGGRTLFGGVEARAAAGDIVSFVLWFNFVAGFAYVVAGTGMLLSKRWAAYLSATIAVATIAVFIGLGIHILGGLAFEARTVGAMSFRSVFWIAIAVLTWRQLR
jgi:hypothetical protein